MKTVHILLALTFLAGAAAPVLSQSSSADKTAATTLPLASGDFQKKRYTIHGKWKVIQNDDQTIVSFGDDFKTKGGPDLKVFLSPEPVSNITGQTALRDAVFLGVLKSNKGKQSYIVPTDVDLSQFESLIIQCEAFSVLWGGFDLPETG